MNETICVSCCKRMDLLENYKLVASYRLGKKYKIIVSLYKCFRCGKKHMTTGQLKKAQEEIKKCRENGIIPL